MDDVKGSERRTWRAKTLVIAMLLDGKRRGNEGGRLWLMGRLDQSKRNLPLLSLASPPGAPASLRTSSLAEPTRLPHSPCAFFDDGRPRRCRMARLRKPQLVVLASDSTLRPWVQANILSSLPSLPSRPGTARRQEPAPAPSRSGGADQVCSHMGSSTPKTAESPSSLAGSRQKPTRSSSEETDQTGKHELHRIGVCKRPGRDGK